MEKFIEIIGAKSHNLKNINCKIPRGKITVITGISGSGKSTLAFDTLFAEGQRRYIESLSTYARQFLEKMDRPDVEAIHGIPPAIAIEQKNSVKNARPPLEQPLRFMTISGSSSPKSVKSFARIAISKSQGIL
jgi:excinuclease ABC subunit A